MPLISLSVGPESVFTRILVPCGLVLYHGFWSATEYDEVIAASNARRYTSAVLSPTVVGGFWRRRDDLADVTFVAQIGTRHATANEVIDVPIALH